MRMLMPAVFLALSAAAPAQDANPLPGTWEWNPTRGACREIHAYRADGSATSESGEEVLQKTYTVAPAAGGMYRVTTTVVSGNGGKDCLGSTTRVGASSTVYIQPLNDGSYFTCGSEDGMSCYGTAKRRTVAQ